ncbi:TPA: hypothetical protein CPT80_06680 [Candidatus Gastranaerophilales bacterium HUM_9]|nr:MAG TPA: hypothetical protein CPT80_06680 [Candidatus Gastranaerophilales bacterium HUM_9]HBX35321.1 hypothetical protein [Cyanobacteria bacterium UBA11440]
MIAQNFYGGKMKEILYTDFEGLDDLLSKMLSENNQLQKAMKRSNLYKFWSKVVGKPFDTKSKPHGMIGATTMVVACESAVVVQELMLRKRQIIKKLAPYVKSLRINLQDIVFDVKRWEQ